MRVTMLLLVLALLVPNSTNAQTSMWVEGQYNATSHIEQVNISTTSKVNSNIGMFVWAIVSENWSEVIVGPHFEPTKWSSLEFGAGIESGTSQIRLLGTLWVGNGKQSLFTAVEKGESGYWYKALASHSLGSKTKVGVHAQRFLGVGPNLEIRPNRLVTAWATYTVLAVERSDTNSLIVGLRLTP